MHFSLNVDPPPPVNDLDELLRLHGDGQKMIKERFTQDPVFANVLLSLNCPYEPWCTNCGGKGRFRCPNRCNRGVVSVPKIVLEAVNTLNGKPIYNERYVDAPCPTCSGKGVAGNFEVCRGTGRQ